jgi:hypothetical protein
LLFIWKSAGTGKYWTLSRFFYKSASRRAARPQSLRSPSRFASLGVINICPAGTEKPLHIIYFTLLNSSCNDFLEVESLTKMSSDRLLSDEKGLQTLLANLYNSIPMEDFNYRPDYGFNRRGWQGGGGEMVMTSMYTGESILSDGNGIGPGNYEFFDGNTTGITGEQIYQISAYGRNRDVSIFLKSVEQAKDEGIINEDRYNRLSSDAHFVRACLYFALAKRYGGVPVIEYLPAPESFTADDGNPLYRATKWAAYALK